MEVIAFKKVKDAYGWMSNMSPHPVKGMGLEFRTAEALFQALRFTDQTVIEAIRAEKSPMGAKMVAKANVAKMVITPRSYEDLHSMRYVLRSKVLQHPQLIKELLDTGDQILIEDVTARQNESGLYWGMAKMDSGEWTGQNQLGKLWMGLRAALREEVKAPMGHPDYGFSTEVFAKLDKK